MDDKELDRRIEAANNMMLPEVEETSITEVTETPAPKDFYQQNLDSRRSYPSKGRYGSRPYVKAVLANLQNSPVKYECKKAKDTIEYLKSSGENHRADMVRQQYMEDYYLPAVDAAVRLSSKQEVLANENILDMLDSYVILPRTRGNGYTKALVQSLYQDATNPIQSDAQVQDALRRIEAISYSGENPGMAIALAKQTKDNIDRGKNIAIADDYEIIQKVALRG